MRLFHFSEEPDIEVFLPRPVRTPAERAPGFEWLNGPLVWAIDEVHEPLYLFPRECPRVLVWPVGNTTPEDRQKWFADGRRMIAHVESAWFESLSSARVFRYELPTASFVSLEDAGMWVSREPVEPLAVKVFDHLPDELEKRNVELRIVPSLAPLKPLWQTSLHASGIRLRNAAGW